MSNDLMTESAGAWLRALGEALLPVREPIPPTDRRAAAVLLPLYRQDGAWQLLFTRRTESVEHHRGQVSFPGGMAEASDRDLAHTALREADEEIGLRPEAVQVLGMMPPRLTTTGFWVTPVVAAIHWPTPLRLNQAEVAHLFGIPLAWLTLPENHKCQALVPPGQTEPVEVITFTSYNGEVVWGATARIVLDFLHLLPPGWE
jgi:8-oxo-dGTP pyrophosphatase MutT (NUDIX family)